MAIVPLTQLLASVSDTGKRWQTDPDTPDNEGWYQFVLDHKGLILANAAPTAIPLDLYSEVRFDIARFFRRQNLTPQYLWVTQLINPQLSDITFDQVPMIYIPDNTYMKQLYEQFQVARSAIAGV